MTQPTTITLNDGHTIPQLGFGVWRLPNEDTPAIIKAAVDAGYRHIDTAQGYDNEEGVGTGIGQLDIPRDELFITSKERTGDQGYESTLKSFDGTMKRLMLETLDLFLIHWPAPRHDRYVETWKAFVDLQKQGRVRSIGVSNFLPEHIERIIKETGVRPAVNQIELHPYYQQRETREWLKAHDIAVECYSPIGGEGAALLKDPVIQDIARSLDRTAAQVVIRWHLQLGLIPLPKTSKPERAVENFDVWDFTLSEDQMKRIEGLDRPDGKTLTQPNDMNNLF